ncbi:MAG TPA: hypothetical protein DEV98_05870 [Clostridiales bacterium]|nr:hypothetical protein [Clostridiales bacterium]
MFYGVHNFPFTKGPSENSPYAREYRIAEELCGEKPEYTKYSFVFTLRFSGKTVNRASPEYPEVPKILHKKGGL